MSGTTGEGERAWHAATTVAALLCVDPAGLGGIRLFARHGPVRDRWLSVVRELNPGPILRMSARAPDEAWFGGLDLAQTMSTGKRCATRGIVERANGGLLVLSEVEKLSPGLAARLAAVAERCSLPCGLGGADDVPPRLDIGYILFDESSSDDQRPATALEEYVAFVIDLDRVAIGDSVANLWTRPGIAEARRLLPDVTTVRGDVEKLARVGLELGVTGIGGLHLALKAARAAAALDARTFVSETDLSIAAGLVLAPRATRLPQEAAQGEPERAPNEEDTSEAPLPEEKNADTTQAGADENIQQRRAPAPSAGEEIVLAAAVAAIPHNLLSCLALLHVGGRPGGSGRSGAERRSHRRGRPLPARRGRPSGDAPLDVVPTLFAAAPWARFRRTALAQRESDGERDGKSRAMRERLIVLPSDFRIKRFAERSQSLAVFVVDASGSMALQRLAESKGAVELMLGEAYSRREMVALVVCNGRGAQLVVPPTRSLTRARRLLGGLPGGGPTPLAGAMDLATELCVSARRHQQTPIVVLLTDGRANVSRDGAIDRAKAFEDALAAARELASYSAAAIVIDSAARAAPHARELAGALDATYLALPHADPLQLCAAVRATHRTAERAQ